MHQARLGEPQRGTCRPRCRDKKSKCNREGSRGGWKAGGHGPSGLPLPAAQREAYEHAGAGRALNSSAREEVRRPRSILRCSSTARRSGVRRAQPRLCDVDGLSVGTASDAKIGGGGSGAPIACATVREFAEGGQGPPVKRDGAGNL